MDNSRKDSDLESELEAMHIADEDIAYPESEAWHELGSTVRQRAAATAAAPPAVVRAFPWRSLFWAAAAAIAAMLIALKQPQPPAAEDAGAVRQAASAGQGRVEMVATTSVEDELTNKDLAILDALVWQSELDALAIDMYDAGLVDPIDREGSIDDLLDSYGIDAAAVMTAYTAHL